MSSQTEEEEWTFYQSYLERYNNSLPIYAFMDRVEKLKPEYKKEEDIKEDRRHTQLEQRVIQLSNALLKNTELLNEAINRIVALEEAIPSHSKVKLNE